MKRLLNWTCCLALAATPVLAANEPVRPSGRATDPRPNDGTATRHRAVDYTSPNWTPTGEEETEARIFLEKNCPRRYATVQRARKDGKVPIPLVRSYFDLEALRTAEPDLYDMKVQQVQLEDKIFGMTEALHGKPAGQSSELREKVRQLVQLRIEEHQKRLDKLKFVADIEAQKLNLLKNNTEQAVDAELERQRSSFDRLANAKQNVPAAPKRDGAVNASPVPKSGE